MDCTPKLRREPKGQIPLNGARATPSGWLYDSETYLETDKPYNPVHKGKELTGTQFIHAPRSLNHARTQTIVPRSNYSPTCSDHDFYWAWRAWHRASLYE